MKFKVLIVPKQTGAALVVVLWMMLLLTLMAATYSLSLRTGILLTAHQLQTAQSRALAEAGIWLAIQELTRPEMERTWATKGGSRQIELGEGEIRISLQDEAGKIDLNRASKELLQSLLQIAGLEQNQLDAVTDAILDWRDTDGQRRPSGAEDADYAAAGLSYGAKNGPFNSLDELRLVLGMNETVFQNIRGELTLYSHQPGINPEVVPLESAFALPDAAAAYSNTLPPGLDEVGAGPMNLQLKGIDRRFFNRIKSRTFTITSEGAIADSKLRLEVVILLKRGASPPFSVLSWREAQPTKRIAEE